MRRQVARTLQPPSLPPPGLNGALHTDPFGRSAFGPWNTESFLYWFIRLIVLTDPTSPRSAIGVNSHALAQSLAIVDDTGDVIGGALNETMPSHVDPTTFRRGDPFLDALGRAHAFELVAATAEHYRALGQAFIMIEATNQWTGAACEALGATRVHFAPFRVQRTVRRSAVPLADIVTSPDGFLSSKDSGSMLYVIRLT